MSYYIMSYYNLAVDSLRKILLDSLNKLFKEKNIAETEIDFLIETPDQDKFGDFATNMAMVCAKILKKSPLIIAEEITKNIDLKDSFFEKFEIKKPGFINFFLNSRWHILALKEVLEKGENFGRTDYGKNKRVLVEFVSANPTGPMHIGNARGGAIGDSLAQCFEFAGFYVEKEFYVNDAGNQIEKFKKSLLIRYEQLYLKDEDFVMPQDCYQGEDIIFHAKNFAKKYKDKFIKASEEEKKDALLKYALPINIKNLKDDLKKYRIEYDNWFFESDLYKKGMVFYIIKKLEEKGYTAKIDGAVWFLYTKCGGLKDEVLIRENGIPTYFASDIAYHYNKFYERKFDIGVDVWGADHHGHINRLKSALNILGVPSSFLNVIIIQIVSLITNGETIKLSKRKGNSIGLNELLNIIDVDVARFFFNSRDPNSHFDFDLALAMEQSDKNPVYYLQYAYARIFGILRNLEKDGISLTFEADFSLLETFEEKELIKQIAKFPQEIIKVVKTNNPSLICKFSIDLAYKFHKFYGACKIKGQKKDLALARLCLCEAVRITLKNAFFILKIEAKEKV